MCVKMRPFSVLAKGSGPIGYRPHPTVLGFRIAAGLAARPKYPLPGAYAAARLRRLQALTERNGALPAACAVLGWEARAGGLEHARHSLRLTGSARKQAGCVCIPLLPSPSALVCKRACPDLTEPLPALARPFATVVALPLVWMFRLQYRSSV